MLEPELKHRVSHRERTAQIDVIPGSSGEEHSAVEAPHRSTKPTLVGGFQGKLLGIGEA